MPTGIFLVGLLLNNDYSINGYEITVLLKELQKKLVTLLATHRSPPGWER